MEPGDEDDPFDNEGEDHLLSGGQDDHGLTNRQESQQQQEPRKLNAEYFEAKLLKESERSVEWLLDQLKPERSRKDRLILQEITGYDYGEGKDEDQATNELLRPTIVEEANEDRQW